MGLDFTRAGHIHCKQGALGEWKLCWIQIKKKQLYLVGSDGTWQQDTDLRKVTNISTGEVVVVMMLVTKAYCIILSTQDLDGEKSRKGIIYT